MEFSGNYRDQLQVSNAYRIIEDPIVKWILSVLMINQSLESMPDQGRLSLCNLVDLGF